MLCSKIQVTTLPRIRTNSEHHKYVRSDLAACSPSRNAVATLRMQHITAFNMRGSVLLAAASQMQATDQFTRVAWPRARDVSCLLAAVARAVQFLRGWRWLAHKRHARTRYVGLRFLVNFIATAT